MQPIFLFPSFVQEISDRKQIIVEKFQKAKLVCFCFFLPLILSGLHPWHLIGFVSICKWKSITGDCRGVSHHTNKFLIFDCWQLLRICAQIYLSLFMKTSFGYRGKFSTKWMYYVALQFKSLLKF